MARRVVVERAGLGAEIVVRQNLQLEASRPGARGKRAMLAVLGDEEGADEAEVGIGRDEDALAGLDEEVAELGRQEDAEDDAGTSDGVSRGLLRTRPTTSWTIWETSRDSLLSLLSELLQSELRLRRRPPRVGLWL